MFHTLLGEASDLERVTPQSRECLHVETTRNKRRCSRSETPSEKSCARPETPSETSVWQTPTDGTPMLVPIPPSPPARSGICLVKLEPVLKTQPSRESLEQVVDAIFASNVCCRCLCVNLESGNTNSKMLSFTTTVLNFALAEAERKGKTRNFSDVHWTWIGRFECRQAVSGFEVQPLGHCDHFST